MSTDLRTKSIVLRRTNYGETDRILNLLTPEGKIAVLARGARREKSRLAGGIEPFSLADVVIHQGRSSLGTLTSARMLRFYGGIITNLARLELASNCLRQLERVTEQVASPEHFSLLNQALSGLHEAIDLDLVSAWFTLNLARIGGEEINLHRDIGGAELLPDVSYSWDFVEKALRPDPGGRFGASEIKFARLLLSNSLVFATKIDHYERLLPPILMLAKSLRTP